VLAVDRIHSWHNARYGASVGPERFEGLRTIEDLPLYAWTKRLLKTARLKGRDVRVRPLDRPEGLDVRIEERVPQFSLRNIRRVERTVEDRPELAVVKTRDRAAEEAFREVRRLRYRPPQLLDRWNMDDVLWLRALLKRYVHQEDWRRRFGRELKSTVQGPLYKYDPDV
jgi:hypothetical protein